MREFCIQDRNLDILDWHFLQASAGTGKTFAIEHLFARLLIQTDMRIEEILVVTFTRAATRELKMRIRSSLLQAKDALLTQTCKSDYLKAVCENGQQEIALKRIDAALVCFDTAQIFTLHAFCHRMLNEFAFESKIGSQLAPIEKMHISSYYRQLVRDFLLNKFNSTDYSPQQIRLLLKKMHNDPGRLVERIVDLLSSQCQIATYPTPDQICQEIAVKLKGFAQVVPDLYMQDLEKLCACYKGMKGYEQQGLLWMRLLQERLCSSSLLEEMLREKEWFLDKMHSANQKVRAKLPSLDSLHYPGLFSKLREEILPLIKEASSPIKTLLRIAKDCRRQIESSFRCKEYLSPDRIVSCMQESIAFPSFVEAVRKKYKAMIVDEFQDTDLHQWKIIKEIFLEHLEVICLVGDPKQSIYAFRSADIYTYLDAALSLGKDKQKSLDVNFRSTPQLIAALNSLFSAPRSPWLTLPKIKGFLPFTPVKAGREDSKELLAQARGSIHFFVSSAQKGRGSTLQAEERLFFFIASEINTVRRSRQLPWEEIAVLIKDRFQAARLLGYLSAQGIPACFRRGKSLTQSVALYAFKEFMQALLDPHDSSKLKIALAGLFVGYNSVQLSQALSAPLLQQAKVQMQLLQRSLYTKGFAFFFSTFLKMRWPPEEKTVEERLQSNPDVYHELRKLSEILFEEEILHKLQGADFLRFLEKIEKLNEEEEQRFEIPSQEVRGSVALMTVHLSKGLEFDTVFALNLASRHVRKEDEICRVGPQGKLVVFDEQDPSCLQAIEEAEAEKMRSLYVALTRAKTQIYIPYIMGENATLTLGDAAPIELFLARLSEEDNPSSLTALYEKIANLDVEKILRQLADGSGITYHLIQNQPSQEQSLLSDCQDACTDFPTQILKTPLMHTNTSLPSLLLPAPHYLCSFSSLVAKNSPAKALQEPLVAQEMLLPLGVKSGIAVHAIFETIFKRGLHHPLQEDKIAECIAHQVDATPLAPWEKTLHALVIAQLNIPILLPNSVLRLKDLPTKQLFAEFEFLFPKDSSHMVKGFADLLFLYEDKYYLLDWKTNYLGASPADYTQEKMELAMQTHHYFLQASIYAAALKRYVKLFDMRPFELLFGGALYFFVRGNAVFHFIPSVYE